MPGHYPNKLFLFMYISKCLFKVVIIPSFTPSSGSLFHVPSTIYMGKRHPLGLFGINLPPPACLFFFNVFPSCLKPVPSTFTLSCPEVKTGYSPYPSPSQFYISSSLSLLCFKEKIISFLIARTQKMQ